MNGRATAENRLGTYLRDRRLKLDPSSFGFSAGRRRTKRLRREEAARRANVRPTWCARLEQGRGAPSAGALDRIARALLLTEVEREHLVLVGLGRRPEVRLARASGTRLGERGAAWAMPQSRSHAVCARPS